MNRYHGRMTLGEPNRTGRPAFLRLVTVLGMALAASPLGAEPHEPLFGFGSVEQPAPPAIRPAPRQRPAASEPERRTTPARRVADPKRDASPLLAVFGDAFAGSIVRGLADADPRDLGWSVVDRVDDGVSLAGADTTPWVAALDAAAKQAGPIGAAVLMAGRNDADGLKTAQGAHLEAGTPEWRALFGERIDRLAAVFRDRHIPLLWVGLPIVRDPDQARTFAAINEVVRDRAVRDGATFIDAWPVFADENGDFTATGPDVNGRPTTLRWTNGWNFTRAGAQKLASFLLPDLKRARDRLRSTETLAVVSNANPDDFDQALSIDINAQIRREAGLPPEPGAAALSQAVRPAGPVLQLTAAPVSDGGILLPLPDPTIHVAAKMPDDAPGAHPGRADDFTWPRRP